MRKNISEKEKIIIDLQDQMSTSKHTRDSSAEYGTFAATTQQRRDLSYLKVRNTTPKALQDKKVTAFGNTFEQALKKHD